MQDSLSSLSSPLLLECAKLLMRAEGRLARGTKEEDRLVRLIRSGHKRGIGGRAN